MRSHDHDHPEFTPDQRSEPESPERREFLRLAGAAMALAGVSACDRAPHGVIVPYASQPPEVTPGIASHYATALLREGYAIGVLVESHEGRPTKVEGNPDHPMSLGGTGVFEQASILDLYDRDRGVRVADHTEDSSLEKLAKRFAPHPDDRGDGTHFILEPQTSPLTLDLIDRVKDRLPQAQFHHHAALTSRNAWAGAITAFGAPLEPQLDLTIADVVVSFDADFLVSGPASLRHARQFATRRRPDRPDDAMSRLYVVEPSPTVTGNTADHRLRLKRSAIVTLMRAIAAEVAPKAIADRLQITPDHAPHDAKWARAVAKDLVAHRGRSVIVVGEGQPPIAHALAHAMNEWLGNVGNTVTYADSPVREAGQLSHDLGALTEMLNRGAVSTLVILGGNPAYATPADLNLSDAIRKATKSLYVGPHENETAASAQWYAPLAHPFERWGDARATGGVISIVQPLREAAVAVRSVDEVLASFARAFEDHVTSHDLVRTFWQQREGAHFADFWRNSLRRGMVVGSELPRRAPPRIDVDAIVRGILDLPLDAPPGLELSLREDARVRDGASANNPWLLELPDPTTKLTWDNAALLSKTTANRLGVRDGDVVQLTLDSRSIELPALVVLGQAEDAVTVALGYGRRGSESIASNVGANAYALQTSARRWGGPNLKVTATGRKADLSITQHHFSLEGLDEDVLLRATRGNLPSLASDVRARNSVKRSLYTLPLSGGRQWGMVIDLSMCTGCSACVVACQAENNIPTVGKAGVFKGREMHWLRIDRYARGDDDDAQISFEPMMCQHCERAPCEYVCPVNATTHSSDGLNQMVYNRCVGTRFCSNGCPWKVRRFNWFDYDLDPDTPDPRVHNPDVTVRGRGVMEKCTYCVQRIREAEISSKVEGRALADGDVRTACEAACPSAAIVFGDIADARSEVSRARTSGRLFGVLNETGAIPHTRYLARIDNPNEDLT